MAILRDFFLGWVFFFLLWFCFLFFFFLGLVFCAGFFFFFLWLVIYFFLPFGSRMGRNLFLFFAQSPFFSFDFPSARPLPGPVTPMAGEVFVPRANLSELAFPLFHGEYFLQGVSSELPFFPRSMIRSWSKLPIPAG